MKETLFNNYKIKSFNEEESFSFGGLWQCDYMIEGFLLPGKYLLEEEIKAIDGPYYGLIQIIKKSNWRNDIRFNIVVIDFDNKELFKSIQDFPALSLLQIKDKKVYYSEKFNNKEASLDQYLEINASNFSEIGKL